MNEHNCGVIVCKGFYCVCKAGGRRLDVGVEGDPGVRAGPGSVGQLGCGRVGESGLVDGREGRRHGGPQGRDALATERVAADGSPGLLDVREDISELLERHGLDLPPGRGREGWQRGASLRLARDGLGGGRDIGGETDMRLFRDGGSDLVPSDRRTYFRSSRDEATQNSSGDKRRQSLRTANLRSSSDSFFDRGFDVFLFGAPAVPTTLARTFGWSLAVTLLRRAASSL